VADATGIPRLSERAEAAIGAVAQAGTERECAAAWRAAQGKASVAAELRGFRAAVERRLGAEAVRAMLRAEGRPGAVSAPSVPREHKAALDRVARLTAAIHAGEPVHARQVETARQTARASPRQGPRLGP
jgi:hypothetical protein